VRSGWVGGGESAPRDLLSHLSLHQWQLYWSEVMAPSKMSHLHSSMIKLKGKKGNLSSAREKSEFMLWGTSSTEPWTKPRS